MSFPLIQGATPFSGTIPADVWTLIADEVSVAKITNEDPASQEVWLTYANPLDTAPVAFDVADSKWRLIDDTAQFENGAGQSKIYAYAKNKSAKIGVQT